MVYAPFAVLKRLRAARASLIAPPASGVYRRWPAARAPVLGPLRYSVGEAITADPLWSKRSAGALARTAVVLTHSDADRSAHRGGPALTRGHPPLLPARPAGAGAARDQRHQAPLTSSAWRPSSGQTSWAPWRPRHSEHDANGRISDRIVPSVPLGVLPHPPHAGVGHRLRHAVAGGRAPIIALGASPGAWW